MKEKVKEGVQPYWFMIDGKWHNCITIIKDGVISNYLNGELQSTSRELTQDEITAIYNNGKSVMGVHNRDSI